MFALCGSTPETPQETEPPPKAASVSGEDEDEVAATEDEQEEALMVPQVKVAEDGSLIIDEERSVLLNCLLVPFHMMSACKVHSPCFQLDGGGAAS